MPSAAFAAPQRWLAQGDIFERLLFVRAGVADSTATSALDHSPALLISHGCAIDKKSSGGRSRLEYLSFLPLQSVTALPRERQENLRRSDGQLRPYEAMYLGDVPSVGESYVLLTQPYTLPASLLRTELREFTAEETGEEAGSRVVATMWETRVACLSDNALDLFTRKWIAQWTRMLVESDA